MYKLFYELIQVAIGSRERLSKIPSKEEWRFLYEIAKKQSLVGICFAGLQKLGANADEGLASIGIDEMQYLTWMGMAAKIQQRNEVVSRQCKILQERLAADGMRSCILKGQGVALTYGSHLCPLRQSGDIDIWVDASREKVLDYGMQMKPTKVFDQKHIHYPFFEDTSVEAHWIPVKRENPQWNKVIGEFLVNERERQFSNVIDGLCVPTADFQLAHQLLHVYGHYVYEGVGMRQIMDLYFALRATSESEGHDTYYKNIRDLFKKLGLMRFVATTQWVLAEVFGMPREMMLCQPDAEEGQKLLEDIQIAGNFGHHDARNHVKGESFVGRFLRRWRRRFRMFRFDPLGTLLMPFTRLKLEIWMRKVRKKYGV